VNLRITAAVVAVLAAATPVFAQRPAQPSSSTTTGIQFRPFAVLTVERFTASTTFDATLDSAFQVLWGGGLQVATRKNWFVDVSVTRMSRNGQRAFVDGDGQQFRLAVPLHATLTPVEVGFGRRFTIRHRPARRRQMTVIPYVGAGVGVYRYTESSDFSVAGEDVDSTHVGYLVLGGAEFRVSKWVGIAADAQYTRVPGIFGKGGVSQQAGESDLGGIAGRVRVILGR
jgi:opacity protein-like surface antigen